MKIYVIGTGTMGSGVVQAFAQAGMPVVMKSRAQAGLDKAVETAEGWIRGSVAREHPLKRQRKRAGLTQRALADLSGTSLRVIRSYEQGQRSLGSASVDTVRRLCRVLACRQEDIL